MRRHSANAGPEGYWRLLSELRKIVRLGQVKAKHPPIVCHFKCPYCVNFQFWLNDLDLTLQVVHDHNRMFNHPEGKV